MNLTPLDQNILVALKRGDYDTKTELDERIAAEFECSKSAAASARRRLEADYGPDFDLAGILDEAAGDVTTDIGATDDSATKRKIDRTKDEIPPDQVDPPADPPKQKKEYNAKLKLEAHPITIGEIRQKAGDGHKLACEIFVEMGFDGSDGEQGYHRIPRPTNALDADLRDSRSLDEGKNSQKYALKRSWPPVNCFFAHELQLTDGALETRSVELVGKLKGDKVDVSLVEGDYTMKLVVSVDLPPAEAARLTPMIGKPTVFLTIDHKQLDLFEQ